MSVNFSVIAFLERIEVKGISSLRRSRLMKFQEDCWYIRYIMGGRALDLGWLKDNLRNEIMCPVEKNWLYVFCLAGV